MHYANYFSVRHQTKLKNIPLYFEEIEFLMASKICSHHVINSSWCEQVAQPRRNKPEHTYQCLARVSCRIPPPSPNPKMIMKLAVRIKTNYLFRNWTIACRCSHDATPQLITSHRLILFLKQIGTTWVYITCMILQIAFM